MDLINLFIVVVVLALVFSIVWWILGQMPIPEPFRMVVNVLVGLIAIVVLLSLVFGGINIPSLRLRG